MPQSWLDKFAEHSFRNKVSGINRHLILFTDMPEIGIIPTH